MAERERRTNRNSRRRLGRLVVAAATLAFAAPASAQLLPLDSGGLPGLPGGLILQRVPQTLDRTANGLEKTLDTVVRDTVGRPRDTHALERDLSGARVVRGEVLAVAPSDAGLAAAGNLGFAILRRDSLAALGLSAVVLRAPEGMSVTRALAALRKADPAGSYDYNHVYDPGGESDGAEGPDSAGQGVFGVARIGMIDAGIDVKHPALSHARVDVKRFAGEHAAPATAHGTAVASLLVGADEGFHGALSGTALYAADVFGGAADGGSAEDIARALAWLASQDVPVVNISLAGPPNALLAAATAAFLARGHVVVAAVGNDGPAAPLRYPAGYPGVAGVTAVDAQHQIQIDAGRGSDVAFAADGVEVRAAGVGRHYRRVTGTSFAAPAVAARFAVLVPEADPAFVRRAWAALARAAVDLGAPGRDPVFGYGYLAAPQAPATRRAAAD